MWYSKQYYLVLGSDRMGLLSLKELSDWACSWHLTFTSEIRLNYKAQHSDWGKLTSGQPEYFFKSIDERDAAYSKENFLFCLTLIGN